MVCARPFRSCGSKRSILARSKSRPPRLAQFSWPCLIPILPASREACRVMTRHHATTFYFASHVLPAQKRSDAYAVYAFCRYVDDQVDLAPDEPARLRAFADLEHVLHAAYCAVEPDSLARSLPWLVAFQETIRRRAIPESYFKDLLAGVEMDRGRVRLANWEELDRYCYLVAGVVGLIMVHVMTEPAPELLKPARDLGTAMQLTNILRDIREDWLRDRLYLPEDELAKFSLTADDIAAQRMDESVSRPDAFSDRSRPRLLRSGRSRHRGCPTTAPVFARV